MTPFEWLAFVIGLAAASTYAAWWYRTREEPVRGRGLAALLRVTALAGAWLLFLNPELPVAVRRASPASAVLLDASLSMSRPAGPNDPSLWQRALDTLPLSENVWFFGGDPPRYQGEDSLSDRPLFRESRLAPAVRAAAAAGAGRILIVSDGEIVDSSSAVEALRRHGLTASFIDVSAPYPQSGIERVDAPAWLEEDDTAEVRVEVVASPGGADTLGVEIIDAGGRVLARRLVPRPDAGRFVTTRLRFALDASPDYHRLVARLGGDSLDLERRDDQRPFYVRVTDRPAGPVMISLKPDWDASFLLPHLDRLSDAPAAAYAWIADSLVSLDDYRRVSEGAVARAARDAPLLLVHGYGSEAPDWVHQRVREADRLLMFPTGTEAFELPGWGVSVGAARGGEWYLTDRVPASPLALSLEGIPLDELPPLVRVRNVEGGEGVTPLMVRRLRRGEAVPALRMGEADSRRWAVAMGEGYWRWAFRRGEGRQLYRALWAGLGGWLLEDAGPSDRRVAPLERVVERGEALTWAIPPAVDSMSIVVESGDSAVWRGTAAGGDSVRARLAPGRYRYRLRAFGTGEAGLATGGPIEVEEFSSELLPRPSVVVEGTYGSDRLEAGEGSRGLARLGWPFLVLIVLFCAEWAVRRMSGLS